MTNYEKYLNKLIEELKKMPKEEFNKLLESYEGGGWYEILKNGNFIQIEEDENQIEFDKTFKKKMWDILA